MNNHFNNILLDRVQKAGLLVPLRQARSRILREVNSWIRRGCPSPAPTVVKLAVVRSYVEQSGARVFIETGTLIGTTLDYISRNRQIRCFSIDIDDRYHNRAVEIFKKRSNATLLLGDSGEVLPQLIRGIDEPAVFWLDGHYSGGATGKSESDTPVSEELSAILDHRVKEHTILIDDAREFTGAGDYPPLSSIFNFFESHPHYRVEVNTDIIRITPRH